MVSRLDQRQFYLVNYDVQKVRHTSNTRCVLKFNLTCDVFPKSIYQYIVQTFGIEKSEWLRQRGYFDTMQISAIYEPVVDELGFRVYIDMTPEEYFEYRLSWE